MTETTEPRWWPAWQTDDLDAFAQLIDRYQADVLAVAFATVLDHQLAEDVAQEAFITAFLRRAQLRDPSAIGGWLAAIARNRGRDLLRRRRRERLVEPRELDMERDDDDRASALDRAARTRDVWRAIERVPARYREVLVLYYAHERSVTSIAHSLGLSETATMQRLSRGRRLLRRHAGDLACLARTVRPSRTFTTMVLAVLAMRQRAEAAPSASDGTRRGRSRLGRTSIARRAGWIVGLAAALGVLRSDRASGQSPQDEPAIASTTLASPNATLPMVSGTASSVAGPDDAVEHVAPTAASSRVSISLPDPPAASRTVEQSRPRGALVRPALPRRVPPRTVALDAAIITCSEPPAPPLAVEHAAPCEAGCIPAPVASPRAPLPYDQINGLLETAALPRAGDVSYETLGVNMIVRAGVTRHLALHVGMTPLDTDRGTPRANANPAFGGGVKLGARFSRHGAVAVLAEAAREVNLKTLETREGWIGRAYATVTLGTPMNNVTLVGGVISEFDGTNRWRSPVIGVSTNLGWDDNLGFVLETQRFTTPRGSLDGTSVLAVRFRDHAVRGNFLGIDRVRIDAGAMLLERTNDEVDGLPWLQAGLGW